MVKKTKNEAGIQEITVDDLKTELGAGEKPVVIDVREGGEVQRGKVKKNPFVDIYIYIYIYMCVCVCVRACVRACASVMCLYMFIII